MALGVEIRDDFRGPGLRLRRSAGSWLALHRLHGDGGDRSHGQRPPPWRTSARDWPIPSPGTTLRRSWDPVPSVSTSCSRAAWRPTRRWWRPSGRSCKGRSGCTPSTGFPVRSGRRWRRGAVRGQAARTSLFKGFLPAEAPTRHSFECHHCSNRCEVNVIEAAGERAYFGDACERYTSGALPKSCRVPNLAEEYAAQCESMFGSSADPGRRIGIPRSSGLAGHLPFWAVFWKELGFCPVLSDASSQETLSLGLTHLSVGVCLPIKLTAGHVHNLLSKGIEPVFLPSMVLFPGEDAAHSYACPYTMAAPYMVDMLAPGKGPRPGHPLRKRGRVHQRVRTPAGWAPRFQGPGLPSPSGRATWAQAEVDEIFRRRARALIKEGAGRHVFGILGRPYGLFDSYANLGLFERLRRMEVLAVPLPFIPTAKEGTGPGSSLPWRYPTDMHRTAADLAEDPGIHPVVLSSFACGPDAFALGADPGWRSGTGPTWSLELDEHRGRSGAGHPPGGLPRSTRRCLQPVLPARRRPAASHGFRSLCAPPGPHPLLLGLRLRVQWPCSGFMGHEASVLPPSNGASRALGERHSMGKECHAYTLVAGDLLQMAASAPAEGTTFFFPGTSLPCLLHEYGPALQAMLDELGIKGIRVSSPDGEQLLSMFGFKAPRTVLRWAACHRDPDESRLPDSARTSGRRGPRTGSTGRISSGSRLRSPGEPSWTRWTSRLHASGRCPRLRRGTGPWWGSRETSTRGVKPDRQPGPGPLDGVPGPGGPGPPPSRSISLISGSPSGSTRASQQGMWRGPSSTDPWALRRALQQWRVRNVVGTTFARGGEAGLREGEATGRSLHAQRGP